MRDKNRLNRLALLAVPAVGMAVSCAIVPPLAAGLAAPAVPAVLLAVLGAALGAAMSISSLAAALSASGLAATALALILARRAEAGATAGWLRAAFSTAVPDAAMAASAGALPSMLVALALGALFGWLLNRRGGAVFAVAFCLAALGLSLALKPQLSFGPALPGLLGAMTAFALTSGVPLDGGAWRVLIPVGISAVIALVLMPGLGMTWGPLEDAAARVREAFDDYFRFTEERVPFTISTEGYNHAILDGEEAVARLGGPANPSTDVALIASSDAEVLLRGSIRRTYTGHIWQDAAPKTRYLFADFTRRRVRESVFGMRGNEGLEAIHVRVEPVSGHTSTLFVPTRLDAFDYHGGTALYYNSIGEMFLPRLAEPSDAYELTGFQPVGPALRQATLNGGAEEGYNAATEECLQLPEGIEEGVYRLTMEITAGCETDYDKAAAIQSWLQENCTYTLDPGWPDDDRDFVSQFVLDGRAGYCSYFASAMAVMCRIAGLPSRYVEGYSVPAGENVFVTGEDAHAWTEVWLRGFGWAAFDPTGGSARRAADPDGSDDGQDGQEDSPDATPSIAPPGVSSQTTPPPATGDEDEGASPSPSPSPAPYPEGPGVTPEPDPFSGLLEEPDNSPNRPAVWPWLLLALLLLALGALAWFVRRRLAQADPARLSEETRSARKACLILYRGILGALAQGGMTPMAGETPDAFARRAVDRGAADDRLVRFTEAVTGAIYAKKSPPRGAAALGREALSDVIGRLTRREKLRLFASRVVHGPGDAEQIP